MIALLVPPPHIADAGRGFKGQGVGADCHLRYLGANNAGGKKPLQAMKD